MFFYIDVWYTKVKAAAMPPRLCCVEWPDTVYSVRMVPGLFFAQAIRRKWPSSVPAALGAVTRESYFRFLFRAALAAFFFLVRSAFCFRVSSFEGPSTNGRYDALIPLFTWRPDNFMSRLLKLIFSSFMLTRYMGRYHFRRCRDTSCSRPPLFQGRYDHPALGNFQPVQFSHSSA